MTLRLNLGAGEDRREGFVSVDLRAEVADVVAPVDDLPYGSGTVDELLALDVLEHQTRDEIPAVLAEWRRVLRPGGLLTVRVPNLLVLARQLVMEANSAAGSPSSPHTAVQATIENIYGGHRWGVRGVLDTHHTGWVPVTLEADLRTAGFAVLANDGRANMALRCERVR